MYFAYTFAPRMTIGHNPLGSSSTLNVKTAEVSDEDTYVCETTFLEPMESCDNTGSFSIGLQVHGYNKFLHFVLFLLITIPQPKHIIHKPTAGIPI